MPTATLPPPFAYPGDADAQIVRGADAHARAFGAPPARHVAARRLGLARGGRGLRARRHRLARHRRGQPVALAGHVAAAGAARARRSVSRVAPRRRRPGVPRSRALRQDRLRLRARRRRTPAWPISGARASRRGHLDGAAGRAAAGADLPRRREPVGVVPEQRRAVPAHAVRRAVERSRARHRVDRRAPGRGAGARRAWVACTRARGSTRPSHLDRRSDQEPRLGAARPRARALRPRASPRAPATAQRDAAFERLLAAEGSRLVLVVRRAVPLDGGRALRRALPRAPRRRLRRARPADRRASSTSRSPAPSRDGARAPTRVSAPWGFIRPHSAAIASTTGKAPGAIACRAARPWPISPLVSSLLFGFDRKTLYLRLEPADGRAAELAGARLELDVAIPAQSDRHVAVASRGDGALTVDGKRERRQRARPYHRAGAAAVVTRRGRPTSACS